MSPIVNGFLAHNMTQPFETFTRSNSSFPTATPFPFQAKSGWSPSDIGTLVFGGIASLLGILTLWATFWLGHRRTLCVADEGENREREETRVDDVPPEYTVVKRDPRDTLDEH